MSEEIQRLQLELDQYQQQIEKLENENEAYRLKFDFLRGMTHEFRTPLGPIIGSSLMLLKMPLDSEQREYVETIQEASMVLLSRVNEFADLIKQE